MLLEKLHKLVLVHVDDEQKMKWLKIWNSIAPRKEEEGFPTWSISDIVYLSPPRGYLLVSCGVHLSLFVFLLILFLTTIVHWLLLGFYSWLHILPTTWRIRRMNIWIHGFQKVLRVSGPMWRTGQNNYGGIASSKEFTIHVKLVIHKSTLLKDQLDLEMVAQ